MTKRIDNNVGSYGEASAQDAFTSEGGHVVGEPAVGPGPVEVALAERRRLMMEFSIQYDGRRYVWNGYGYDRLADAVAYAGLMRPQWAHEGSAASLPRGHAAIDLPSHSPSAVDRQLMAELSVSFEAGAYVFRGFRYDRLADAASYARLCQRTQALEAAP